MTIIWDVMHVLIYTCACMCVCVSASPLSLSLSLSLSLFLSFCFLYCSVSLFVQVHWWRSKFLSNSSCSSELGGRNCHYFIVLSEFSVSCGFPSFCKVVISSMRPELTPSIVQLILFLIVMHVLIYTCACMCVCVSASPLSLSLSLSLSLFLSFCFLYCSVSLFVQVHWWRSKFLSV